MNAPVTAIDERYSESKAGAVSWDETRKWHGAHAKGNPFGATTHRF